MSVARPYLDYNASAPLLPQARAAMMAVIASTGNPSSVHAEGRRLRGIIETARDQVAALVNARPSEVIFTSGATEANVTALASGWDHVLMAGIEHDSVLAPVRASKARIVDVSVERSGQVDAGSIAAYVLKGPGLPGRAVIALQLANNETGVMQPVAEVARFARGHGLSVHCDAVQGAGRVAVDFADLGVDTMALSAHKMGGPTGVGALIVRDGFAVDLCMRGGGQERRRRAGTENVIGITGFGAAAQVARAGLVAMNHVGALRDRLEAGLMQATPHAVIFGRGADRLANTTCIGVPGRHSEITLIKLDVAGFAVSAGSACSSGKVGASHVLAAMGAEPGAARGAIRISLGTGTTVDEIDAFLAAWRDIHMAQVGSVPTSANFTTSGRAFEAATATGD